MSVLCSEISCDTISPNKLRNNNKTIGSKQKYKRKLIAQFGDSTPTSRDSVPRKDNPIISMSQVITTLYLSEYSL